MSDRKGSPIEAILARVDGSRSEPRYQKDQSVFLQGDPADAVFYVQSGRVAVTMLSPEGKTAVVAVLGPGSFCGEDCLGGRAHRLTTARGLTEYAVVRIAKGPALRALDQDVEFAALFRSHLMERNERLQEDLADQLLNSTEKRLARLLLRLANYSEVPGQLPDPIVPRISQETLAEMIGTTRTNVNFFMNKFRQQGFIAYDGEIKVNASLRGVLDSRPAARGD